MLYDDVELKVKVAYTLDVTEFMDAVELSFEELLDLVFDELDEEQKDELARTVEFQPKQKEVSDEDY